MKIALAGVGDVGRYFAEVYNDSPHEVVVLTRTKKPFLDELKIEQRITDYTADSLTKNLEDCDAVVSTVNGDNDSYLATHRALLEACTRSPKCKRFIPSEYATNVQGFPDQPSFIQDSRIPFRRELKAQHDVKWTTVCCYFFMEYMLPPSERYLKEIGLAWCGDHEKKEWEMYADGHTKLSMTSVRDVARAVQLILENEGEWPDFTHFAGDTMSYNELFQQLKKRDSAWTSRTLSFTDAIGSITQSIQNGGDAADESVRIMGYSRVNELTDEHGVAGKKVLGKALNGVTIEALMDGAAQRRST